VECLHVANFTPVPSDAADSWRNIAITLVDRALSVIACLQQSRSSTHTLVDSGKFFQSFRGEFIGPVPPEDKSEKRIADE
jgi:hypothetical protein